MKIQPTGPSRRCLSPVVVVVIGLLALLPGTSLAQERYRDLLFSEVVVESGVEFGAGLRADREPQLLFMDVYSPAEDPLSRRPVVVLAFPGGFVDGARDNPEMVAMATRFARHGFVAASIDYRLIEGRPRSSGELQVSILQAVHDMRAAVRFFREDAATGNRFGTDGRNVFAGGISAGAVMAAGAGVLDDGDELGSTASAFLADNGGMAGNSSDNTGFSSAVSGVLQISGAIRDTDWIESDSPPIFAAHEEFDPIVPCKTSVGLGFAAFGLALRSSGACDVIPVARDLGVATDFVFDKGSLNHVGFSDTEFLQILDDSAAFFYNEVLRPRTLASAVLPGSRTVQVGETATVFAAVINTATIDVEGCTVAPMTEVDASFSFQAASATNSAAGSPNEPFSITAGATKNLILQFTPTDKFQATSVFLRYQCEETSAARNAAGLNTLLLAGVDDPAADIIGLTTVVDLVAAVNEPALFAVGSANVGATEEINVRLDDAGTNLPLALEICRTDSATGGCIEAPSSVSSLAYEAGTTASFAVVVTPTGNIANDPARHRIFIRFEDASGRVRGATSTAVRTE